VSTPPRAPARLRVRLAQPRILVAPGAADALTARLIERAGFEAVYFSGAGFSYTHLGVPDLGLVGLSEMAWRAGTICAATTLPVIADADTGYGNALAIPRTVREFERAGVAAIQLEDQVAPKRCGHLAGKRVVSTAEMVGKIKAAVDSRRDPDFMVIARTDAAAMDGLDAAIERAERYHDAGADVLFVEAPESEEELAAIARRLPPPVMANMVEGGRTPVRAARDLQAMGYRLVIFPGAAVRAAAGAITRMLAALARDGTTAAVAGDMLSFSELNAVLDLSGFQRWEARYVPGGGEEERQ
jgi:methylisocitrate lyase